MEEINEKALASRILLAGDGSSVNALKESINLFQDKRILFDLITGVYMHDGYNFPRNLILKAKSIAKDIPAEERLNGLPPGDPVTVYRATSTWNESFAHIVKCETSWTTCKNVAIWFAYRLYKGYADRGATPPVQPLTIWRGQIARDKIIAYLTDRGEDEVLQHNNVKGLETLPAPSEAEVTAAFEEHERRCNEK